MLIPISVTLSRYFGENVLVIVIPGTQGKISSNESEGHMIFRSFKCSGPISKDFFTSVPC